MGEGCIAILLAATDAIATAIRGSACEGASRIAPWRTPSYAVGWGITGNSLSGAPMTLLNTDSTAGHNDASRLPVRGDVRLSIPFSFFTVTLPSKCRRRFARVAAT